MPCCHSRACFGSPLTACQQYVKQKTNERKFIINPLVIYICINMSKIVDVRGVASEIASSTHFSFVDVAKIDTKKTSQIVWNVLGKIWECLGRIWEKTNRFPLLFVTFYLILEPLHNNHRTVSSHHPEVGNYSICPHPPSRISDS